MKKLILTAGTEFEQNGTDAAIIDDNIRAGKPININMYDLAEAIRRADKDAREAYSDAIDGFIH